MNFDNDNKHFQLALQFVNHTRKNIFLTGKAGTGKTTFLKYLRDNSFKKMAIAAPTGVAAINAGGVTLHSLFQLPIGSFIPTMKSGWGDQYNGAFNNKHTLLKNIRIGNDKRRLFNELELLIIDEVSMVRSDLLDAVDTVLRTFRKNLSQPFGGIQIVFIGDLYQLPPVVTNDEWGVLNEYYQSPFFFDAQVFKEAPPLYLELKKIYRQKDEAFITLLNNIRNNVTTKDDIDLLNKYYRPDFQPGANGNYITLTTHNSKADIINQAELDKLSSRPTVFEAEISGEFYEKAHPAEKRLCLKEGAQVMFIKNDKGEARRYFNGKIAIISKIYKDSITVKSPNESREIEIEKETWKNIRYSYNVEHDKIEEDELGSFTQYPLRLAWAITIHKSQGLTFDRAIIDAGASFANGQVYVALSRLTALSGLILYSRINMEAIHTDERITGFAKSEKDSTTLFDILERSQKEFISESLLQSYSFKKLLNDFQNHHDEYPSRQIPEKEKAIEWSYSMLNLLNKQKEIADKFIAQLERLIPHAAENNYQLLNERIRAATEYFTKSFAEPEAMLKKQMDKSKLKAKTKKYLKSLNTLQFILKQKLQQIKTAEQISSDLAYGKTSNELLNVLSASKYNTTNETQTQQFNEKNFKPQKGDSHRISLQLYKEGKPIKEIAELRSLAVSTIEGHLASFVRTGEIKVTALVNENKIPIIIKAIEQSESRSTSVVREITGDQYSHAEIRAVMNYLEYFSIKKKETDEEVFL